MRRLFQGTFCRILFSALLGIASLTGANMRPDEIEKLMHDMNQPVIAHTVKDDRDVSE
jgi:hypothetical protein